MTDKKKPAAEPAPKQKLTDEETSKVTGGRMMQNSDQCKETADSGAMGCPS